MAALATALVPALVPAAQATVTPVRGNDGLPALSSRPRTVPRAAARERNKDLGGLDERRGPGGGPHRGRSPSRHRDLVIEAEVSDRSPYLGEQVVYRVRVLHTSRIGKVQFEPPRPEGLLQAASFTKTDYSTTRNGTSFAVMEFTIPFFPQRAGTITLGSARFEAAMLVGVRAGGGLIRDDFETGRTEPVDVGTDPIVLQVRALPAAPAGFSGLVGATAVRTTVVPTELQRGDAATLTVEVVTDGDADALGSPRVDLLAFDVRGDDARAEADVQDDGRLLSTVRFGHAFVAERSGRYEISPVRIPYFDPVSGQYRTATSEALELRVGREDATTTTAAAPARIDRDKREAIHTVRMEVPAAVVQDPRSGPGWVGWLLALVAALAFGADGGWVRRVRRAEQDPGWARGRKALKGVRAALEEADGLATDGARFHEEMGRALRQYVGDKLDMPAGRLTPEEIEQQLGVAGVAGPTCVEVRELLHACERRRITRSTQGAGELRSLASSLVDRLEVELSPRRKGRAA